MKKNIFALTVGGALTVAMLSGCESSRLQPAGVEPRGEVVAVVRERSVSEDEMVKRAAAQPLASVEGEGWRDLFDGRSLAGWKLTEFESGGSVEVQHGLLLLWQADPFVGVNYTNDFPKVNYELTFEAMRVAGSDFFCGLTFPVQDSFCSLIIGGWGGSLVGISNVDGADASENETTTFINFETGRWYRVRLRVTEQRIEAWVEQKKVVDLITTGRKLSLRFGDIELSKPFGIASWSTSSAFRGIKLRSVYEPAEPAR